MAMVTMIVKGGHVDGTHHVELTDDRFPVNDDDEGARICSLFLVSNAQPGWHVKCTTNIAIEMAQELGTSAPRRLGHRAHKYVLISDTTDETGHRILHVEHAGIIEPKPKT